MKILQLISSGGHFGAESMLLNLSQGLQGGGHDVVVGVFRNAQNPNVEIAERLQSKGIATEILPCQGRLDWSTVRAMRVLARRRSIDLAHSHGFKADCYLAAAEPTRAKVATCHGWPGTSLTLKAYARLDRRILRSFSQIGTVSRNVHAHLQRAGVAPERMTTIPNGIDAEPYRQAFPAPGIRTNDPHAVVVGLVGRLSTEKGWTMLVQAALRVVATVPEARFVFVGEGPQRRELELSIRELGLERNFHFAGKRKDMAEVYAAFDMVVLPSFDENMPMVILEAMAAAKPVIATNVGENPRVIVPGETGTLVQSRCADQLGEAILQLSCNRALAVEMGKKGRQRVESTFSLGLLTERYLKLYEASLRGTDGPALNVQQVKRPLQGSNGHGPERHLPW